VVEREIRSGTKQGKFRATCGVPECGKEFEFEDRESRVFELPPAIFERRHFIGLNCGTRDCSVNRHSTLHIPFWVSFGIGISGSASCEPCFEARRINALPFL
jgi:hypothetical protein